MNGLFRPEWSTLKKLMFLQSASGGGYATIVGNPVTFTAKAAPLRQLEVAFSPVQDLHGYDSPWPAGGGKNKFCFPEYSGNNYIPATSGLTSISVDEDEQTLTLGTLGQGQTLVFVARPFQAGQCAISFDVSKYNKRSAIRCFDANDNILTGADISVTGATWNSFYKGFYLSQGVVTVPNEVDHFWVGIGVADDQSGDTVVISNVQLEFGSSVTSYSPYSNICPISGWSSLTVEQMGKNLLDLAAWLDSIGIQYTVDNDGWFVANSTSGNSGNVYTNVYTLPLIQGSAFMELDQSRTTATNLRMSLLRNGTQVAESGTGNPSVAKIENREFNQFRLNFGSGGTFCIKVSVVNATTISEYTPYNPSSRSISISLGQTVYSGTLDVVTGVGEITWEKRIASNLSWYNASTANVFRTPLDDRASGPDVLCSAYPQTNMTQSIAEMPDKHFKLNATNAAAFYIKDTTYDNADSFKAAMGNMEIAYRLAEPIPFTVDPQEILSLLGDNVMFTPCDSLTVEYRSN